MWYKVGGRSTLNKTLYEAKLFSRILGRKLSSKDYASK